MLMPGYLKKKKKVIRGSLLEILNHRVLGSALGTGCLVSQEEASCLLCGASLPTREGSLQCPPLFLPRSLAPLSLTGACVSSHCAQPQGPGGLVICRSFPELTLLNLLAAFDCAACPSAILSSLSSVTLRSLLRSPGCWPWHPFLLSEHTLPYQLPSPLPRWA